MNELLNTITEGDCRAVMQSMPESSVDVILTSPPYNVGLKYDGYEDRLSDEEFRQFNKEWLLDAYRVMSEGGRLYAVISDAMLFWFREVAESVGWIYAQKLVWCKPNFVGSAGKVTNDWNYMTEDILLFRKGKRTPMQNGDTTTHNWFLETVPQSNFKEGRIHPAQMPVSLCMRILDRTPGEVVMDPFAGSGSVLVAAKKLGRKYVGIELVGAVVQKAIKRLNSTQAPLITLEPQPEQLEML